tara:strand:- start:1136 stop:1558 length:423 start_codon:yes stop_codon:yes gene_type:complete
MVKKTISKLKKELDKFFSLFIRLRYATENLGLVQCFTCGKVAHYKTGGMQCGHFQSRRHHSTRWDEKNCQVQCVRCNMFSGNGEQYKFGVALDHKYGAGTAEELEFVARFIAKITRSDYEDKISYYKLAVKNLKKEKGIE